MRPKELIEFIEVMIKYREALMITGAPGTGKTDLVGQATANADHDLIVSHPVVSDPTDAKGMPWVAADKKSAIFLPFGDVLKALTCKKPTVWFIDDIGQASPAVQASFMQPILARRTANGDKFPEHLTFIGATNRRTDKSGVQGILEALKSRFASIVELDVHLDDWCEWAIDNLMPAELIAFLRYRGQTGSGLLHQFTPTTDMTNSPCPRTWAAVGRMSNMGLSSSLEFPAYAGAVGQGAAVEYLSFLKIYRTMPSLDAIIMDPDGSPIPSEPSQLFAIATGLASKTTNTNFPRIARFITRLVDKAYGEFAVLLVKDASRRNPQLCNTTSFIKLVTGDFGKLLSGEGA